MELIEIHCSNKLQKIILNEILHDSVNMCVIFMYNVVLSFEEHASAYCLRYARKTLISYPFSYQVRYAKFVI